MSTYENGFWRVLTFGKHEMISLRPYQIECLDAIRAAKERGVTRPLFSMATGLGKTVVFASLAKELGCRTLIVAHRDELIAQAAEKVGMIWDGSVEIGIVKAERHEPNAQIVVASIQSACREQRLYDLKEAGFDLCIIDEAHHAAAGTYQRLVRQLGFLQNDPNKLLLGVTATPKRGDGIGLDSMFQEIVFNRSIAWGIRSGYLSPLVGRRISTKVSINSVKTRESDFSASELSGTINIPARNRLVVESFAQYGIGRKKVIAFCADVQHARDLAQAFNDAGIATAVIFGEMAIDDRRAALERFETEEIRVLTNCGVLTEGFDSPQVDCILLARPTQSSGLYAQCVGRGTRTAPGKKNCLVLDFVDASRLALCDFANALEGIVKEQRSESEEKRDRRIPGMVLPVVSEDAECIASDVQEIDFFRRSAFAWVQVGDAWHLPVGDRRDIWVRKASLSGYRVVLNEDQQAVPLACKDLPLPYALGVAEDWVRSQRIEPLIRKDAAWRSDPASKKQIATLWKFGITQTSGLTKGAASDLLQEQFVRRRGRMPARGI